MWYIALDPSIELLDLLECNFCVHGDDIPTTATGEEGYADVRKANRIRIIKRTEGCPFIFMFIQLSSRFCLTLLDLLGVSTTDLVGRLLLMSRDHRKHFSASRLYPFWVFRRHKSIFLFFLLIDSRSPPRPRKTSTNKEESGFVVFQCFALALFSDSLDIRTEEEDATPASSRDGTPNSTPTNLSSKNFAEEFQHRGMSNFLPTTRRISQVLFAFIFTLSLSFLFRLADLYFCANSSPGKESPNRQTRSCTLQVCLQSCLPSI